LTDHSAHKHVFRFPWIFLLLSTLLFQSISGISRAFADTPQEHSQKTPEHQDTIGQAALQEKFRKVITSSLTMQKVPFKNFTWLDPKEVTGNVTAFPFAIDIGNKRIVSVVYLVNGRYLATSPLLDITDNYKPVPPIPPPSLISMNIPSSLFSLEKFPSSGKPSDTALVIEFGDDQCPVCRKWNQNEEQKVLQDPSIRFTYIPMPLVTIHQNALKAALFEMCAYQIRPSSFWTIHDLLNRRVELGSVDEKDLDGVLNGLASSQALPATKMNQCMSEQSPLPDIETADNTLTQKTGIPTTPTFIVGGQVKTGYLTYGEIKKLLGQKK
jgi:protein-disulfide isomerase